MTRTLAQHYLDLRATEAPGATALSDGSRSLTHAELADRSNRIAHWLRAGRVPRRGRVVLCLERTVDPVVAMLGVLKADAAYVPLDPKAPVDRWATMVADCRPDAAICDGPNAKRLAEVLGMGEGAPAMLVLTPAADLPDRLRSSAASLDDLAGSPTHQPEYRNGPDDVAYLLYTSGSTGKPKGVMISHRNIRCYIDWAVECFGVTADDVVLGTAPFHFDMSVFDVYVPLAAGARMAVAGAGHTLFPGRLVDYIEQEGVTIWKGVSSLLMYMDRARVLGPERMPTVRWVLFGGETLPTRSLIHWMQTFPGKRSCNAYCPTEATGISLFHVMDEPPASPTERIPIGRPCADTEALLLAADGTRAAPGEHGELCLAGPCLSPGYLDEPEATERAFMEAWSDGDGPPRRLYRTGDIVELNARGEIEFIGRRDGQVKYMGYRIELGEIEHALQAVEGVQAAAVILHEDGQAGLRELVGFYEAGADGAALDVQAELARRLPPYMMPRRMIHLDRLPRGDRGKVDRAALAGMV